MITLISFIVGLISIMSYILYVMLKFGIVKSISFSDYLLNKPFKALFEIALTISGMAIIIIGLTLSKDNIITLQVIGGSLIIGVAIFSRFKLNKFYQYAHYICAIGGFSLISLSFWINLNQWYVTLGIAIIVLITYLFSKIKIWSVEIALIISNFIAILFNI